MSKQREAMKMALNVIDNINTQYALPSDLIAIGKAKTMLREALADDEPDMRHPKIQSLIGAKARLQIELRLVEQLLDDPHFETTASDMEYWNTIHDRLYKVLTEYKSNKHKHHCLLNNMPDGTCAVCGEKVSKSK